ncbi:MAG: saccharopine dehydrogenase NADP-binding domain-containing protein [Acidaminobacteraceae bacterium]
MKDKILVVGATGKVGSQVALKLSNQNPGKVIIASRNIENCNKLHLQSDFKTIPMQLDVNNIINDDFLESVMTVIVCLDLINVNFFTACIKHNTNYIDITANFEYMKQVESTIKKYSSSKSIVLMGVGLSPGMSNLIAKKLLSNYDKPISSTISILIGTGDKHGKAALEWLVDNINIDYGLKLDKSIKTAKAFTHIVDTEFPLDYGKMPTYNFNFADQHIIGKKYNLDTSLTTITYSSRFITKCFYTFIKLGFMKVIKSSFSKKLLVLLLGKLEFGSNQYAIKVDTSGYLNGCFRTFHYAITGKDESLITSAVASSAANKVHHSKIKPGFYYLNDLFSFCDFAEDLEGIVDNFEMSS